MWMCTHVHTTIAAFLYIRPEGLVIPRARSKPVSCTRQETEIKRARVNVESNAEDREHNCTFFFHSHYLLRRSSGSAAKNPSSVFARHLHAIYSYNDSRRARLHSRCSFPSRVERHFFTPHESRSELFQKSEQKNPKTHTLGRHRYRLSTYFVRSLSLLNGLVLLETQSVLQMFLKTRLRLHH